ncbi:MAG TPA: LPS export ABC transporter permease LptG [Pseudomonadales bacterium]|nr:LPS export ABC transporter permease LptG [Pseudomonadales bacterium]
MKRLDSYLARTITMTMLMAEFGLLGIMTIFTFLEQVQDIKNNYDMTAVLMFCLYSMPRMFYEVIPYSALIGCLAGLGMLANNSELIVMRAAGVSTWSICLSAVKPTLLLVILGLLVGEYVLPGVETIARNDRTKAITGNDKITPAYGLWYREGNVYMHFDQVGPGDVLDGVSHYYFDGNHDLKRTLFAKRAVYHNVSDNEKYWLMEDVVVTDIYPDHTDSKKLASLRWNTRIEPNLLKTEVLVSPDKMSIAELRRKIDYMRHQGLNSGQFEVGYWQKLMQPLATVGLVFIAISFIFGPLRESTMGMRVVAGLVIGILFKFVQDLLSPASLVYGFPPFVAIMLPIAACFAIGYVLMRRAS